MARLNFSHGTHEEYSEILKTIRAEAKKQKRHIAVLQDLERRQEGISGGVRTILQQLRDVFR